MRIFLSGFGTVGQGFAEVIKRRRDFFEDKYGEQPVVVGVIDSIKYDLLIEVSPTDVETGGTGLKTIRHALECGKDVITVNKGPLALHFHNLIALAKKNGCKFRFEGSV